MVNRTGTPASWPLSPEALQRWSRMTDEQRAFVRGYAGTAIAAAETAFAVVEEIDSTRARRDKPVAKRSNLRLVGDAQSARDDKADI